MVSMVTFCGFVVALAKGYLYFVISTYTYFLLPQIGLFAKISLQNCPNLAVLLQDGEWSIEANY